MAAAPGPPRERTRVRVRLQPVAVGLVLLGCLAALLGIVTRNDVLGMLAVSVAVVVVWDVVAARRAVRDVRLAITGPTTAEVGSVVPHVLDARGLVQPLVLTQPSWSVTPREVLAVPTEGPGIVSLDAPHRGVRPDVVVDVASPGPLGLAEAAFRERLVLPTPLHITPAALRHDPDWPRLRTIPYGEAATVTRGEDLFRGVRPYTRGDPRRSVHWPATAHHGTLMVREHDGLELVALRVVVVLTSGGPAAEAAVARAAWLVDHALGRGFLVHLVTVTAPPPPPAPLGQPWAPQPLAPPLLTTVETVERRVTSPTEARVQLAAAGIGVPAIEPWTGLTREVGPGGDRWL